MIGDEQREAQKGAVNLTLENKEFPAVTVGSLCGVSMSITFSVVVPIMTNAVAVKEGEELLLLVQLLGLRLRTVTRTRTSIPTSSTSSSSEGTPFKAQRTTTTR